MYYALGVAAGAAAGLIIMVIIVRLIRKGTHQNGTWAKYDERQQIARGKGYRCAFFTMVFLNAAAMLLYNIEDGPEFQIPVPVVFLGIMIAGLLVYISYAIWTDAYIGTNETFRSSLILIAFVGACNLAVGMLNTQSGFEETYINLAIGGMMAVVCLEMIAKNLYNKQIDDNGEE